MAIDAATLQILIEAKNRAGAELSAAGDQVRGLSGDFGLLAKGAAVAGAAMAAMKLGDVAFELGRASASSLRLAGALDDLARSAGTTGQAMLTAMKEASQGTIDDTTLIAQANQAMLLEVAQSSQDMVKLLELSAARGKATGRAAAEALGDIVTGIGRLSPQILDNLGIVIDQEQAYTAYAASLGKTADELTNAERKQALLNVAYDQSRELIRAQAEEGEDLAAKFERMDASLANAKDALGALFSPAAAKIAEGLAAAADSVAAAAENIKERGDLASYRDSVNQAAADVQTLEGELHGLNVVMQQLQDETLDTGQIMLGAWGHQMPQAILGNRQAMIDWVNEAIAARKGALELAQSNEQAAHFMLYAASSASEASRDIGNLAWSMDSVSGSADTARASTAALAAEISNLADRLRDIQTIGISAAGRLKSSFKGAISELGAEGALEGYQAANQALQNQLEVWEQLGLSQEEIDFLAAEYVQTIQDANSELKKTDDTLASMAKNTQAAFDGLVSKVQGVLSGALDTGVGVDPMAFLPREDAVNEDARRLADVVVRGFDSPWAEYLNNKFPNLFAGAFDSGGDLKAAAARALADFQDGLHPELLDKEAAKERVKRMLLGEANLAEMAKEIATELATEMGGQFSMSEIEAAAGQALGVKGGQGPGGGENLGQGVLDGIRAHNTGGKLISEIASQVKEGFETLKKHGEEAGKVWGDGFLTYTKGNIPGELVKILVDLTTPGVYARLQAEGSMSGAVE